MRKLVIGVLSLLLALTFGSATILGVTVTVDENGNGFFGNQPLPSTITADPGPGGQPAVLTYLLPFNTVIGDVIITEPGCSPVVTDCRSDLLRFNGNATLLFYSDVSVNDPANTLADILLPTALYTNVATIPEVGTELNNGALYTPAGGQPGQLVGALGVDYNFISDISTPEPATLLLTAAALGLQALRRRS